MTRLARVSRFALVPLCLLASLAARHGVAAAPASAPAPQWHLDIERAMDAIGLGPGMVVGEAGAGDGYFTIPMARRVGPSGSVFANDISARALRSLEQSLLRLGTARVDIALIHAALVMMRQPARLAGLSTLHDFLERGFSAFQRMNGADAFLATIDARETALLNAIFDGETAPFPDPRAGA